MSNFLFAKLTATEHYAKVKDVLTKFTTEPKLIFFNNTKEGRKALHNLRKNESCMVLTADKEVVLVIIDEDMYIKKCMSLHNDEDILP